MTGGRAQEFSELDHRPWYDRATRWTQLTFVEDDPLHFDRAFWADVMSRTHSDAACISAGGYLAFYPSAVPQHRRSRHLGDLDLFGAVNDDARRLGMVVMARVDPHAVHTDVAAVRPEWLARDESGEPIRHWAVPNAFLTCPFGPYYSEFVVEVIQEIAQTYDVDAVFLNRWNSRSVSYSESARQAYRRQTGQNLPGTGSNDAAEWSTYTRWRAEYLGQQVLRWNDALRAVNPRGSVIPNRGSLLTRDLDEAVSGQLAPAMFVDKQGRSTDEPVWTAGQLGKKARGLHPDLPVTLISSVGPEVPVVRWKDAVASPAEITTRIVDGFLHGASPWFTKFNARVIDPRWVPPIEQAFTLHERAVRLFGDARIEARVAVLDTWRPDPAEVRENPHLDDDPSERGVYQALLEARIPFEYLVGDTLDMNRLREFSVVVLPGNTLLDPEQEQILCAYVESGGAVVGEVVRGATGWKAPAAEPGQLANLAGVLAVDTVRTEVRNNYVAVTEPGHRVTDPFGPTERIVGGTAVAAVRVADDVVVPFRFVPDFPDLPMEEVYAREEPSDPAVVLREHPGGGRTALVAFNLSALFAEMAQVDHADLIAALVRWALNDEVPVSVSGEGLVDLAVRRSSSAVVVAIVNLDAPNTLHGQMRTPRPLGPQTVHVRVPDGVDAVTIRRLSEPDPVRQEVVGGSVDVLVPRIACLEVVEIGWVGGR
ncbi:alpha-amylase family protein [Saccharomonospora sp. NPDC046836]|uniref:alpha-amylase family protein n=1 Tax=Saccharomonospora sp. NPDC046836 TaxID=3156921 RepID=UPI0033DA0803